MPTTTSHRRRPAGLCLMAAGLGLAWSALLGPGVTPARAAPSFFADIVARDIVVTPERMLALVCVDTVGTQRALRLVSVSPSGSTSPFATVVASMPANECHTPSVAISPGLGGFPKGYIYVSSGTAIYRISPDGGTVELFATIPASSTVVSHFHVLTFDDVGDFGYDMLVAGSLGRVYRVRSVGGVAAQFALVPQHDCVATAPLVEVPAHDTFRTAIDVAPADFAPFGGQLLVPHQCHSMLYAISALGLISTVAEAYQAREVQVIPEGICGFANSNAAYFLSRKEAASGDNSLFKFPVRDFTDLRHAVLINYGNDQTGDYHLVALRSINGAISRQPLEGQFDTEMSGGFVECPPPERAVNVADAAVVEGDAGTTAAAFEVTLDSPSTDEVQVRWATSDGSARAGSDYVAASGTLAFPPGQTARTVGVDVIGDPTPEPNETFTLTLEPAKNATLARAKATGTIADDDASPAVTGIDPDRGPLAGGTRVVVTGTRLGGTRVVSFGAGAVSAHPCPVGGGSGSSPCFTEESPTRLSVFSPAATKAGPVHVSVTTPSGTSFPTDADLFTYLAPAVPPPPAEEPPPASPSPEPPAAAPPGQPPAPPTASPPGGVSTPGPGIGPGPGAAPGPANAPGLNTAPGPASAPGPAASPGPAGAPGLAQAPAPGGSPAAQVGLGALPLEAPEAAPRHAMVRHSEPDPAAAAAGAAVFLVGLLLAAAGREPSARCAPGVVR